MALLTEYQKRAQTPCVPPQRYIRGTFCFWVNSRDYDNRETSFKEIWQWQPTSQSWCKPGFVATGQNEKLLGYEIIGICPTPLFEEEYTELTTTLDSVKRRFGGREEAKITRKEYDLIRQYIKDALAHHVKPDIPKKE